MLSGCYIKGCLGWGEGPPGVPALHLLSQRDSPLIFHDRTGWGESGQGRGKGAEKKSQGGLSLF